MYGKNELSEKLVEKLIANGYEYKRCKGSHFIYGDGSRTVSVPKDLNKMIYKRLVKECGFEDD